MEGREAVGALVDSISDQVGQLAYQGSGPGLLKLRDRFVWAVRMSAPLRARSVVGARAPTYTSAFLGEPVTNV